MPQEKATAVGGLLSASGSTSVQRVARVDDGGAFITGPFLAENLPRFNVWAYQTAPLTVGAGMTVEILGAVYMLAPGDSADYKAFASFVLAPGVPIAPYAAGGGFLFPCALWRLRFTMPAGFGTGTVEYILAASA